MSGNADAAAQAVSMVTEMQGKIVKVSADIAGELSMEMLKIMFLVISNNNKTKGQQEIYNMLKTGDTVKCIEIRAEGVPQFDRLAKDERLEYNAVENVGLGCCRILFKAQDIEKVNRILEKMPASVKLTGEALMQHYAEQEIEKEEYQKDSMGISGGNVVTEDVNVSKERSVVIPDNMVTAKHGSMDEGSVNFTQPEISSENTAPSSANTAETKETKNSMVPKEINLNELYKGKESVVAQLNRNHDLAGNDPEKALGSELIEDAVNVSESR